MNNKECYYSINETRGVVDNRQDLAPVSQTMINQRVRNQNGIKTPLLSPVAPLEEKEHEEESYSELAVDSCGAISWCIWGIFFS